MTQVEQDSHGSRVRLRILEKGVALWRVDPSYVTARRLAQELDLTHSVVLYHFGNIVALKNAIAYHAVEQGESRVIVHLIAGGHAAVASMSDVERQEHMRLAR